MKILAVNARFPGSVHDAGIWATSQIRQLLQNSYIGGDHSSWLIGMHFCGLLYSFLSVK